MHGYYNVFSQFDKVILDLSWRVTHKWTVELFFAITNLKKQII